MHAYGSAGAEGDASQSFTGCEGLGAALLVADLLAHGYTPNFE